MLRAFLVSPFGVLAVYATLLLVDPLDGPGGVGAPLMILGALLLLCYVVEATIAWPLFVFLEHRGLANRARAVATGAVLGLLMAGILDSPSVNVGRWRYYAAAGLGGLLAGAVFAHMHLRRPNKRLQPAAAGAIQSRRG